MNQLLDAKSAIARVCKPENRNAFCFVAGAGISAPHIPTAAQMIQEWKGMVDSESIPGSDIRTALDQYEFWFTRAFLFPKERQRYLQDKIRGKPVTTANYALAKILASDYVGKLVITTNFDMCLARALGYLGKEVLVYDHPATANGRLRLDAAEVQIVHVHGTYQYYDCANLKSDIRSQATKMAELVSGILKERSPIVVGYSGWEDDVIMSTLKLHLFEGGLPDAPTPEQIRKAERRCPYPVVWFCYRASELDALPVWLKEHRDVFFVVPSSGILSNRAVGATPNLQDARDSTTVSQPAEPKLPADVVFQTFVAELKIPDYDVEKDPVTFHIGELKGLIRGLTESEVSRVAEFTRTLLQARATVDEIHSYIARLECGRALQRSNEYLEHQDLEALDSEIARDLVDAICKAALGSGDIEEGMKAWNHMIALCDTLRERGKADEGVEERWSKAWAGKGLNYLALRDYGPAIQCFDQILTRWASSIPTALEDVVASSQVNKGIALCHLRKPTLDGQGSEEILSLYAQVIGRHEGTADPELRESLASAKVNTAYLYTMIGREAEGFAVYDEVINQFGVSAEPALQEHVARAMINKAFHLGEKFEPEFTRHSQQLYEEITSRFNPGAYAGMRTKMALAWNGLAWQSILMAKLAFGAKESGLPMLQRAKQAIHRAKELMPGDSLILGNEAYAEFLLGNKQDSRRILEEAIRVGGARCRDMELRDSGVYPLPQDTEFATSVREISSSALGIAATQSDKG